MPVDANIFQQYLKPVRSMSDYGDDMDKAESNKLTLAASRFSNQQAQQGVADDQKIRQAYQQSGGDQNKLMQLLQGGGQYKAGQALQKTMQDTQKAQGEIKKDEAQTAKFGADTAKTEEETKYLAATHHAQGLAYVQTPQDIVTYIDQGIAKGVFQPEQRQAMLQKANSFGSIEEFKKAGEAASVPALERYKTAAENARNKLNNDTSIANNTATNATSRANNASSNATTQRGQNMTAGTAAAGREQSDSQHKDTMRMKERELGVNGESGASVLGVPAPAVLPWANQSNSKDSNKVKAKEQERGAKEIEKDADAARLDQSAAVSAQQFVKLNTSTATGGLVDRMGVTRWAQGMGAEYSDMEAIAAKLAPAMRPAGSGSTSDADLAMFKQSTVGVDKPSKTNQNIANGIIARAKQSQEYVDFRQTYLEQNGTLNGSDRHWKDYADKNPIFDPEKTGTFDLNTKRKTWSEHFKGNGKPAAPGGGGLSDSEQAELAQLRQRLKK